MRPVSNEFPTNQEFGEGATQGIVGNVNAPTDTMEYYVGLYGNYQPFGHAGQDIACPIGTPIRAIADGTVLYAGWAEDLPGDDSWGPSGYFARWALYKYFGGIITVIQHNGWISVTAHQSNNDAVYVGQRVTEGQQIGLSGNTKTRTDTVAPHVHVEALVYLDYRIDVSNGIVYGRVDPTPYFGGIAAQGTISEDEDLANVPQEEWDWAKKVLTALSDNAVTDKKLADALAPLPVKVWGYVNPGIGGGDAYQILRDAVANTNRIAADVAKVAAASAAAGATEAQITEAVKAAISQSIVNVDVTVNGVQK